MQMRPAGDEAGSGQVRNDDNVGGSVGKNPLADSSKQVRVQILYSAFPLISRCYHCGCA